MKRLKFALIGCGRISGNHIKAILDNYEDAELVCVCDILKDRVELKADEYLIKAQERNIPAVKPNVYADYRKMLQKEDINVCVICTESGYHAEISLYCLNLKKQD